MERKKSEFQQEINNNNNNNNRAKVFKVLLELNFGGICFKLQVVGLVEGFF